MTRFSILAAAAAFCLSAPAGGQERASDEAEDAVTAPQLETSEGDRSDAVTADQLNVAMAAALASGSVEQLDLGEGGVIIFQAEGGADRCAPGQDPQPDFCAELLERREVMRQAQARMRGDAESDLSAGSPLAINRFSIDPGATADLIGRGRTDTLAAQAVAADLLNAPERSAPPPESLPELSPEAAQGVLEILAPGSGG